VREILADAAPLLEDLRRVILHVGRAGLVSQVVAEILDK
jgi:hypothetical protein